MQAAQPRWKERLKEKCHTGHEEQIKITGRYLNRERNHRRIRVSANI